MAVRGLLKSVLGDRSALILMGQIIADLVKKIFLAFIINKILSRHIAVLKIRLIIGEQKTACAKDVKSPQGNAAFDAPQRNI